MMKRIRTMKKIRKSRQNLFTGAMLAFAFLSTPSANAYNFKSPIDDSRHDYGSGMTRKLGRGLANTGLGWTEVFQGMEDVNKESGFLAGATWGPLYGAANAVKRTAVGVFETLTFPVAGPNRFDPVLEPEYPLTSN